MVSISISMIFQDNIPFSQNSLKFCKSSFLFFNTTNKTKPPTRSVSSPFQTNLRRSSSVRLVNNPSSVGMVPVSWLLPTIVTTNSNKNDKIQNNIDVRR